MQAQVNDFRATVAHLRDQNLVLRAAQTSIVPEETESNNVTTVNGGYVKVEAEKYQAVITELESRLSEYHSIINEYKRKLEESNETDIVRKLKGKSEELEKLRKDQDDLLELLTEQESKISLYKEKLAALGEKVCNLVKAPS